MRLTTQQQHIIRDLVREHLDQHARIVLFGSRTDDNAIGGDIDLLVDLPAKAPLAREIALSASLEQQLGEPVDLIVSYAGQEPRPIVGLARMTGIQL